MSFRDESIDGFAEQLAEFGAAVTYSPGSGSTRTVTAAVERQYYDAEPHGVQEALTLRMFDHDHDEYSGVTASEFDRNADAFIVDGERYRSHHNPRRVGGVIVFHCLPG